MRRGPIVLLAAGVVLLLASIPATGLGRSPARLVATSRHILVAASSTPSPSASPTAPATPQPTQAAPPSAAVAVAVAPSTPVVARISIPRIGIRNAPVYDRRTDGKGVMLIAPGYSVTRYAFSAPLGLATRSSTHTTTSRAISSATSTIWGLAILSRSPLAARHRSTG